MGSQIVSVLNRAGQGQRLTGKEIISILELKQNTDIEALFRIARNLRREYFGNRVFLYGFLYTSTYCRNDCNFCYYRASNNFSHRYRKEETEIIDAAVQLAQSGVHLIDLTMGEDPHFFNGCHDGLNSLVRLVEKVKTAVQRPVMVSPGVVPGPVLANLARAGADWFACYQETHNRRLFKRLRPDQDYDVRLNAKKQAREHGLLIEEGILVGVGETPADVVHSLEVMEQLGAHQVRAMNFVPREHTPMGNRVPPDPLRELLLIALMRLLFPGKLIPATLDVEGLAGLKRRLAAGANVVTSIVPPKQGLAGVARSFLDIEAARRTIGSILPVLEGCGLQPAGPQSYQTWLDNIRRSYSRV
jgi:methylornithine synthase